MYDLLLRQIIQWLDDKIQKDIIKLYLSDDTVIRYVHLTES